MAMLFTRLKTTSEIGLATKITDCVISVSTNKIIVNIDVTWMYMMW